MSDLFHKALHMLDSIMRKAESADFEKPTPCTEWNVRALMNHIVYELAWVAPLLEGKKIAEIGNEFEGDILGSDPFSTWHQHMEKAIQAASTTPGNAMVQLSSGDTSVDAYLHEVGGDLVIHGWDLSKAIGAEYMIDDQTAAEVEEGLSKIMPMARRTGKIAEALPVAEGASSAEKLLASCGRDINWGK